jgi:DNA helicase HerA-like ATPase
MTMQTPIEEVAALTIGTVESVAPSEIRVLLETDAPQATALNTGAPTGFPRINGYVLIPNETGAVVGMIVWLGVERSAFPKRTGMKDFGLIDLPFPLRKLALTPLGTLIQKKDKDSYHYKLERGVAAFPSVGDPVLLPTAKQLRNIIEASDPADQRVAIGTSPLASDSQVTVDPDKIFGRHLAVLGNTGSGKSCSVAGLIRWSLEKAKEERQRQERNDKVNARFIILDPNGEYSSSFADFPDVRHFRVPPVSNGVKELVLPAWMWNSHEWCSFAHAAPGVQRPILLQALREMRAGQALTEPIERQVGRLFRSYKAMLDARIAQGASGYAGFPENKNCGGLLSNIATDAGGYATDSQGNLQSNLNNLKTIAESTAQAKRWKPKRGKPQNSEGYNDFSEMDIRNVLDAVNSVLHVLPSDLQPTPISEDAPVSFAVDSLPDHLEQIASNAPGGQASQFIATLSMRIRMMLADQRLGPVVNPKNMGSVSFDRWLIDYVGDNNAANGQLAILDLSLVSADVLHILIAVIARIVFEAIQRYRRIEQKELPTVLVLEEAHTFIHCGSDQEEGNPTPVQMCRRTFERIAREGRKFGLGLVLSSQRPSELSPTVLAQCNTFLLHRIVNDRDQELVAKLVPDNLGGLLRELPSLPSRQAILLGWAAPIPALVEITELPEKHRPRSADPKFWEVWTGEEERVVDWKKIAEDWTGNTKLER